MVSGISSGAVYNYSQLLSSNADVLEEAEKSGKDVVLFDIEAGQAFVVGPGGQLTLATTEQLEKYLKENGIKLDNKSGQFKDVYTNSPMSPADINASQSVGGVPVLPAVNSSAMSGVFAGMEATKVNALSNAFSRFGDQGLEASALMLQGLLAVLHSSQEQREGNMQLTVTGSNLKNIMLDSEAKAKDIQIQARINEADQALTKAIVMGVVSVAVAGAACGLSASSKVSDSAAKTINTLVQAGGSLVKIAVQWAMQNTQEENTKSRQAGEMDEQQARIEEEVIEQALDFVKSASTDNKEEMKQVMKLLQDIAQRQADNVRMLTN